MSSSTKLSSAELLYRSAHAKGLNPSWVIPGGIFVINTVDGDRYINRACSPFNTQIAISLSSNKYLARLIMQRNGLPNIPFARPKTQAEAQAFLSTHKKIIVKPVKGAGSHDIHIVSDMSEIADIDITHYIFEKYVVGTEMRYLVLSDTVIAVHESEYGTSVQEDRALQRISYHQDDWDPKLIEMSLHISKILGLQFAAVDYLIDDAGGIHILEVNSKPGLKWFHAPTTGPAVDVASLFLESIL